MKHGAGAPQVKAKAAVRAEVLAWGLGSADVSPEECLLRLISQSAARAARYAEELERMERERGLASALVGKSTFIDADGQARDLGEHVRGMAKLESDERDRLARFSALAINAGLAARQVALAERIGGMIADVLRAVLADHSLALTAEQLAAAPMAIRRHLGLAGGPPAIEGETL
jgi:hypothetical protein